MEGYGPETYGDRIAEVYDEWYSGTEQRDSLDTEAAVDTLAELAGQGPVLELAVGTGRLALPLSKRGLEVHGIDASPAMVQKLRAKPGGDAIRVTMGDFADVAVAGSYRLIFIAFNTFFALLTQEHQLRCFENVAARLEDDGVFVLEAFVPDLARFDRDQRVDTSLIELERVTVNVSRHDPLAQRVDSQHILLTRRGVELYPVSIRYAWPAELDLMARLAGLRIRDRWGGWQREPFGAGSLHHVSVYGS